MLSQKLQRSVQAAYRRKVGGHIVRHMVAV